MSEYHVVSTWQVQARPSCGRRLRDLPRRALAELGESIWLVEDLEPVLRTVLAGAHAYPRSAERQLGIGYILWRRGGYEDPSCATLVMRALQTAKYAPGACPYCGPNIAVGDAQIKGTRMGPVQAPNPNVRSLTSGTEHRPGMTSRSSPPAVRTAYWRRRPDPVAARRFRRLPETAGQRSSGPGASNDLGAAESQLGPLDAERRRIAGPKDAASAFWLSCHQRLPSQRRAGPVRPHSRRAALQVTADRPEVRSWRTKPGGRRGGAAHDGRVSSRAGCAGSGCSPAR